MPKKGFKHTKETREKMSKTHIERTKDAKTRIPFEIKECACGCGETFQAKLYWKNGEYKLKKFISGHSQRTKEGRERAKKSIHIAKSISLETNRGENNNLYKGQYYFSKVRGRYMVGCRNSSEPWARIVMRNKIGRDLKPGEVVHHINGIKDDDRPENLMLFSSASEHIKWHWDNDMAPH